MLSIADRVHQEGLEEVRALAPAERIERAFRLGEDDLEAYRRGRGLDREEAIRQLELRRQRGRRRSACMLALLG